ncbi:MAG TPA: glucokinase, partial [Spirochaetales bacterium]|nr:glucokinase [Spirochaetales bacterium]
IRMSNAAWILDQAAIAASLGMPCFLINDFSAVAWGILTLHADRDDELTVLRRPDGSAAHGDPWGPMVALGAGTGLGCAWTTRDGGRPRVYPSEGGHVSIPVYDDQSERLASWLKARYSRPAGVEAAVSGQGLANIFLFLSGVDAHPTQTSLDILSQPESRRPALIAAAAGSDSLCARAMTMFVELYARTAANMALAFMPSGGIYLAGGVAAKNLAWFTDGALFMRNFLDSYREHTRAILEDTPVYVVRNYDISLVGASNAARVLSGAEDSA